MTVSVQLETSESETKPPKYWIRGFARASDHTASAIAAEGGGSSCSCKCAYSASSNWRSRDWSSRMFTWDLNAESSDARECLGLVVYRPGVRSSEVSGDVVVIS